MSSEIKKVGVLGAGLMGHGIAQVTATAGYDVVLREVDDETLQKGLGKIEKQLAKAVEKGKVQPGGRRRVRGRIQGTTDYNDLADCDLVIEAITEDLGRKLEMWKEVDAIVKPEAVVRDEHVVAGRDRPGGVDDAPGSSSSACTTSTRPRS
jgi:3-hydroxybutyryl-CoA dehydrogenase